MEDIEIINLRHSLFEAEARCSADLAVINILEKENAHLRQVIEMLITSKSPTCREN